ncbi:MAG: hypothetical protein G01um101416_363 [Microgenomates group bacterium Gr01-1014_16]|nr:MAG: hypothetical protein G01um101416_363 [Microgenomates group bacterium Gr01-1014_16]
MKKFIILYHAPASAVEQMSKASPEEMKKGMEPWMAWAQKVGDKGDKMVDFGTPLGNGQSVSKSGSSASNSDVNGYTIIRADSMEQAVELLKKHPHLDWADGCKIEVFESLSIPGME